MATKSSGKALQQQKSFEEMTRAELLELAHENKAACEHLFARWDKNGTTEAIVDVATDPVFNTIAVIHNDHFMKECYQRKSKQLRQEMGWETSSALERMLIERIIVCWHNVSSLERVYASKKSDGGLLTDNAEQWERLLERAEKRHEAAIVSLAKVRRLQLPAVQLNIGENQVNLIQARPEEVPPQIEK